jgi:hypothetical protein
VPYLGGILPEPVTGAIEPRALATAALGGLRLSGKPVRYRAYDADGGRFAWTTVPDRAGRFHAFVIEPGPEGRPTVTDARAFPSVHYAQGWAGKRWAEANGYRNVSEIGPDEPPAG